MKALAQKVDPYTATAASSRSDFFPHGNVLNVFSLHHALSSKDRPTSFLVPAPTGALVAFISLDYQIQSCCLLFCFLLCLKLKCHWASPGPQPSSLCEVTGGRWLPRASPDHRAALPLHLLAWFCPPFVN